MSARVAVIDHEQVLAEIEPAEAIRLVEEAFTRFTDGDWVMPPKVYLTSPSGGDFRAMPSMGGGLAILKWITSFPDNPARGLPTVTGTVLVSDAENGEPIAIVDARSVTALRTGASAAVATRALARSDAVTAGVVGSGLHGAWAARCLREIGYSNGVCYDVDMGRAQELAAELGWRAGDLSEALGCDVVTTVTPGRAHVVRRTDLLPGQHLNALGADGSGKAEMEPEAVVACRVFVDEWEQASHGGEIAGAVAAGSIGRSDCVELGRVLGGSEPGRTSAEDITLFDSTGLAIQDLAIVRGLIDRMRSGSMQTRSVSL